MKNGKEQIDDIDNLNNIISYFIEAETKNRQKADNIIKQSKILILFAIINLFLILSNYYYIITLFILLIIILYNLITLNKIKKDISFYQLFQQLSKDEKEQIIQKQYGK